MADSTPMWPGVFLVRPSLPATTACGASSDRLPASLNQLLSRSSALSSRKSTAHQSVQTRHGVTPRLVGSPPPAVPPLLRPVLPPSSYGDTRGPSSRANAIRLIANEVCAAQSKFTLASIQSKPGRSDCVWANPNRVRVGIPVAESGLHLGALAHILRSAPGLC